VPKAPITAARAGLSGLGFLLLAACAGGPPRAATAAGPAPVRIVFLHHSTGEEIWKGGLAGWFRSWNAGHATRYEISEQDYPACAGPHPRLRRMLPARVFNLLFRNHYPWNNYPYDYWNLWVRHAGPDRDRGELNLDDLAQRYDVIVFKHCFPVSAVQPDDPVPDVASQRGTLATYRLQYDALKERMRQFPKVKFILWTGPPLTQAATRPEEAARAQAFADWVKREWDQPGDNIFLWDFRQLATGGGLYLQPATATSLTDSHPSRPFAARVAPLLGRRIVDVIEGRGDGAGLTGE
jgi:hypothetical protein